MLEFDDERGEADWDTLDPVLQQIADEFGHWSASQRLPVPVITCTRRTVEENRAIYGGVFKFSWHLAGKDGIHHAIDFRTKHYTVEQLAKVIAWFNMKCPDPKKFELIVKPHGTGPHIHLGHRVRT